MDNSKQFYWDHIKRHSVGLKNKLIAFRRDFHMHPELSGQEERTAKIVADRLEALGLEVQQNVGGHGVIGLLKGNRESPVVALRADMDAFPGDDVIDKPYRSQVPGVKHICGHDVHTSIGLGIAEVFASMKENIPGTVKFIFQPAEETAQGAKAMINDGALENPRPNAIFAQHVSPMPVGSYIWTKGLFLTGLEAYLVSLSDKEHERPMDELKEAASECINAVLSLNTLKFPASLDELDAFIQDVRLGADYLEEFMVFNAALGEERLDDNPVSFQLFYKTPSQNLNKQAYDLVLKTIDEILSPEKIRFEIKHVGNLPDTINNDDLILDSLVPIAMAVGEDNMQEFKSPTPFNGEDFSYFQQEIPGAIYFLGCSNREKGIIAMPHMPDFDVDEDCLVVGTYTMATIMLDFLLRNQDDS